MQQEHGLFIPDKEYLTDIKGLIAHLGQKISIGNICLYCNGRGKAFFSVEAVQAHMVIKQKKTPFRIRQEIFFLGRNSQKKCGS